MTVTMTPEDRRAMLAICDRYGVASVIRFCAQMVSHTEEDMHYAIETRTALCKIAKGLESHASEAPAYPVKG